MKNCNDTIGNRTRDLPACIAVPQLTAPPPAPTLHNGCRNCGRQNAVATEFSTVTFNICGYSVQNLVHVKILVTRIWRWLLEFLEKFVHICLKSFRTAGHILSLNLTNPDI